MENEPTEATEAVEKQTSDSPSEELLADVEMLSIDDTEDQPSETPPRIKDLLFSHDYPSRFVTFLSITFGVLACLCMILLTYVIITHNHGKSNHAETENKEKYIPEAIVQEKIGYFQIVLKAEAGQKLDYDLRVDLTAECSTKEACAFLKTKEVETRDLVNPILSSVTRDELLSLEGKNRIRRRIAEQLNGLVQDGKVNEVRFTNMTIESGRPDQNPK